MANLQRNFIAGIMNKSLDERLLPNGQYVDALNVRLGSTEETEVGSVENTKGNLPVTALEYDGTLLSSEAKCIGAYEDGGNETIYWFVHDPNFPNSPTSKLDLIVSFNVQSATLVYHVISLSNPTGSTTTLNFSPTYLITGVNLVDGELLFFTDDFNPPRVINVNRNYPNPDANNIDGFTAEALLVMKRPPRTSPDLELLSVPTQNNFLEDRFVCFGYRYQYEDGEFSAPSQFSEPAFIPGVFQYDFGIGLNTGMENAINLARISYDSGGPLVKAVELLWKDMTSGSIRAIEKINKLQNNIPDNSTQQYDFSDSKIFTVLPSSEILRLYDNVPRLAKAQTLMGNRLIYGNYLEQYDLVTDAGARTQLNYTLNKITEVIGLENISTDTVSTPYNIDPAGNVITLQDTAIVLENVDNLDLRAGAILDIDLTFRHLQFTGGNAGGPVQPLTPLNFQFILPRDYTSANDLATSAEFLDRIGNAQQPTFAQACDGTTLTDLQNCAVLQNLGTYQKVGAGRSFLGQSIQIDTSPGNPDILIGLNAVKYEDPNTGQDFFEYYRIDSVSVTFQTVGDPKSLHSDRNYEIGIIYMDEFNRASNALVSQENTMFIPCIDSVTKNTIQVDIPTSQIAPYWATRYKFCIKQDKEDYFNVYCSFFFTDPTTGSTYFLLEGQNSTKVEEGDILKVKLDTNGALQSCAFATVIEKKSQIANFLEPVPTIPGTQVEIPIPQGVYATMRPNQFSAEFQPDAIVNLGQRSSSGSGCRQVDYPLTIGDGSGGSVAYDIPQGSKIRIIIDNFRRGNEDSFLGGVSRRKWFVDADFTATQDYPNFKQWFEGDNIAVALQNQADTITCTGPNYDPNGGFEPCQVGAISCNIVGSTASPGATMRFRVRSSEGYSGDKKKTTLKVRIEVIRAQGLIVFETKPQDAVPDVWYISSESYPIAQEDTCEFELSVDSAEPNPIQFDYIDIYGEAKNVILNGGFSTKVVGECGSLVVSPSTPPASASNVTIDSFPLPKGAHIGNVQTQFGGVGGNDNGLINTAFFNCYAFGNGVESYAILDEIAGKELTLGNQVTSTSQQEYQEIRRFADLTYSGVFNDESNVNKLNEFNLGLLNFKPLEEEFGLVMKLDGRETDILCLQEDKISYVLAGKNLLSDATGGGAVTSVPEVLGTQIARIEEYGISFNPESYAKWGSNKFFTDAKRGAVLQLKGSSARNEQLNVISESGMRSWFRDLFIEDFNTQKLGGYDPYMNEYVLSSNQTLLPEIIECVECGVTRTINITESNSSAFCVDVGFTIGSVITTWNVVGGTGDDFNIEAEFNGVTVSSGDTAVGGNLTVNKNVTTPGKVNFFIEMVSGGSVELEFLVECPDANSITIVQVCVTLDQNAGEFIHNEFEWTDGVVQSPKTSVGIQFNSGQQNPLVSQYTTTVGPQGTIAPPDGATVTMFSNKISPPDDFIFDSTTDAFRYLRTNTLYVNTPGNIANLLANSTEALPITGGNILYRANFTMPQGPGQYLYLIYDYRNASPIELCFDQFSSAAACCDCGEFSQNYIVRQCRADGAAVQFIIAQSLNVQLGDFVELVGQGDCVYEVLALTPDPPNATFSQLRNDIQSCNDVCQRYGINNTLGQPATMQYIDCSGVQQSVTLQPGNSIAICLKQIISLTGNLSISLDNCTCQNPGELIYYTVEQCRADGQVVQYVIQDTSNSLNIGNLVSLTSPGLSGCVFEVVAIAAGPDNATVSGIVFGRGCGNQCQQYSLTNPTNNPISVDVVNCANNAVIETVPANTSILICAQNFVSLDPNITVLLTNCNCTPPEPDPGD